MAIRFTGYGQLKRLMQASNGGEPLAPWQSMLAGGIAGAVSAVVSQPVGTVGANMMGLEAARFRSSLACAAELDRAGGFLTLFNGVGPTGPRACVTRVFIEVGLQFSLYESIGRWLGRVLKRSHAQTKVSGGRVSCKKHTGAALDDLGFSGALL